MTDLQKLEAVKECYDKMILSEELFKKKESLAENTTYNFSGLKVQSHTEKNWHEEAVLQMIEARDKYVESTGKYMEALSEAYTIINGLKDPGLINILVGKYIRFKTWKQIAEDMGCSQRNCLRIHKETLNTELTDK